jgi:hypothetical protein
MAFGNISTFYLPTAANAGPSLWGSDVRKLLSSADAGNDTTTKTDHGTGGSVTRTLDPYTTKATDDTESNFGFAVDPVDMGSVAGALRFIPAGDHVATLRTASNQAMTSAQAAYTMYAFRVGPAPARTRTLLGSASGAAFNYGAIANAYRTEAVTLNLPEIIFAADESIQYSLEQACNGVAVLGRINTHDTGTQGGVAVRIDHPGLKVLAEGTGTSSAAATASGVTGKVLAAVGSVSGIGSASGVTGATFAATGAAAGIATASGAASSRWGFTGSADGVATVDGQAGKVIGAVGTVEIGGEGGETIIKRSINYLFPEE